MPFSISGNTITQTGTDNDLSDLAAVAGVTVVTEGSSNSEFKRYTLASQKMRVVGTLTIDPRKESLHFGNGVPGYNITVEANGVLNVGKQYTSRSQSFNTKGLAIEISNMGLVLVPDQGGGAMYVAPNGTFNITGATMKASGGMVFASNSNINITDGHVICTRGLLARIRNRTLNFKLNGLILEGGFSIDFFAAPSEFTGFAPQDQERALEYVSGGSGGTDALYVNEGYTAKGLDYDGSLWNGADVLLKNAAKEFNPTFGGARAGVLRQTGDVEVTFKSTTGSSLSGVKTYFKDFDNGNRNNSQPKSAVDYAFTSDKIYTQVSPTNGKVALEILFRMQSHNVLDWRTKDQDSKVKLHFISYNEKYASSSVDLMTGKTATFDWVMLPDEVITEMNSTTVAGYTTINTPQQFYDYAKSWFVDNYTGQTDVLLKRVGDLIDAGSYDVIIDKNASSVFAFANNTITIKADVFTGDLKTTGEVTLQNGATVSGGILDRNGDSFLTFSGVTQWKVYQTETNANQDINFIGLGASNNIFRFIFASNTTYYLRLTVNAETVFTKVTPTTTGKTLVSLDTPGQLSNLFAEIKKLTNVTEAARDHAYSADAQTKPKSE